MAWERFTVALLFIGYMSVYFCRNPMFVTSLEFKHSEGITQPQFGACTTAVALLWASHGLRPSVAFLGPDVP